MKTPIPRYYWLSALLVALLLVVPVFVGYCYIGSRVLFNFLATDSMYYMGVANNFIKFGFPTLDGELPTNGFHPLWQFVLIVAFKFSSISHHAQPYLVFLLSLLLVYLAHVIISLSLFRLFGRRGGVVATLAMFPGVYSLFFEPRRHFFGDPGVLYTLSPYAAINGMETSLSLFLWASLIAVLIRRCASLSDDATAFDLFSPIFTRICLAAIVLCRLDDCFLIIAIGCSILLQADIPLRRRFFAAFYVFWPTAVVIAIYLTFNYITVNVLLPVSITAKLDNNPSNVPELLGVLFAYRGDWWYLAVRLMPSLFAVWMGATLLTLIRKRRIFSEATNLCRFLLTVVGIFLYLKGAFLLVRVPTYLQGGWYYFSMIVICNLIFAIALAVYVQRNQQRYRLFVLFLVAVTAFRMPNDIQYIISSTQNDNIGAPGVKYSNYTDIAYELWLHGDQIRDALNKSYANNKIIDHQDGMYAYLLDMPAESVAGFVSSPHSLMQRNKLGFWESVVPRGFDIVPDFGYLELKSQDKVRIVATFRPPLSPVTFYKVELINP